MSSYHLNKMWLEEGWFITCPQKICIFIWKPLEMSPRWNTKQGRPLHWCMETYKYHPGPVLDSFIKGFVSKNSSKVFWCFLWTGRSDGLINAKSGARRSGFRIHIIDHPFLVSICLMFNQIFIRVWKPKQV